MYIFIFLELYFNLLKLYNLVYNYFYITNITNISNIDFVSFANFRVELSLKKFCGKKISIGILKKKRYFENVPHLT